jgi:hypothetical protein
MIGRTALDHAITMPEPQRCRNVPWRGMLSWPTH